MMYTFLSKSDKQKTAKNDAMNSNKTSDLCQPNCRFLGSKFSSSDIQIMMFFVSKLIIKIAKNNAMIRNS